MIAVRRVLLLTDAYPPEIRSCPVLMKELAQGLVERGFHVTVLTTWPTYNLTEEDRELYGRRLSNMVQTEDGVRVIRVPVPPLHNVGPVVKGLSEAALPLLMSAAGSLVKAVDAVIVFSPPLSLGLAAAALKVRFGCPIILNVQDLMPQAAMDLGVLKNPLLVKAFEVLEDRCYRHADRITCHSEGNVDWLKTHRPAHAGKLEIVHNWVDVDGYQATEPDREVRGRLGLDLKFVFLFGGVMGFAQDLDTVVEAARRLDDRKDMAFLLVGDGVARERVEAAAMGLTNVVFHPFVAPERYVGWLRAMDAGLVTLRAETRTPVIPSKILGFMASGLPYLAVLGGHSDARRLTANGRCGVMAEPGDPDDVVRAALKLAGDRKKAAGMGRRGLEYCRRHFSRTACIDRYVRLLETL
ncbi:MAG: glycosyltransferase family 4 protein [Deltaproteobacteria bacterium]|nr:glycosyltransferase family 4 protein [Deltaproteobacteria bacterium]